MAMIKPKPTPFPLEPDGVADWMQRDNRWLVWRYVWKDEESKWTKVPCSAITGRLVSATDPSSWTTFEDAYDSYVANGFDGVGYALGGGRVGFDADDVIHDGIIEPIAANALKAIKVGYREKSPSGTGYHVVFIVEGDVVAHRCKKKPFELYSSGRYFTVTGHAFVEQGSPIVKASEFAKLVSILGFERGKEISIDMDELSTFRSDRSDEEALRAAFENDKMARRLFIGDRSSYLKAGGSVDASNADWAFVMALVPACNGDAAQIDRLYRRSGLYREKWDSPRLDSTYGANTIFNAIQKCYEMGLLVQGGGR